MADGRHRHCPNCGARFDPQQAYPRQCGGCGEITYVNPLPVGIVLQPIEDGLLLVRRNIPPGLGELALPGGYMELGETWQECAARELLEETNIRIAPADIRLFDVMTSPGGYLLVFGVAPPLPRRALEAFAPNSETQELVVATSFVPLVFPRHTDAARRWFEGRL